MTKRLLVLFLLIFGTALAAYAGPRIEISEPPCTETDTAVTQLVAGFTVIPVEGQGSFGFCNRTDQDWSSILMAIRTTSQDITCGNGAFIECKVFTDENIEDVTYVLFYGTFVGFGIYYPGVPQDQRFTVNLNCPESDQTCTPWADKTMMFGYANPDPNGPLPIPPVPEPATLALLGSGLTLEFLRRKRWA